MSYSPPCALNDWNVILRPIGPFLDLLTFLSPRVLLAHDGIEQIREKYARLCIRGADDDDGEDGDGIKPRPNICRRWSIMTDATTNAMRFIEMSSERRRLLVCYK